MKPIQHIRLFYLLSCSLFIISFLFSKSNCYAEFVSLQWVKQMGGTMNDQAKSMAMDAQGNIYLTGTFWGTADFDPGTGVYNLTSAGESDIFIVKLDSSGNLTWAKQIGGATNDAGNAITIDIHGNVYITGSFEGTVDFDPGTGVYNLAALTSDNAFVEKLDANGNFVWAGKFASTSNGFGNGISVDNNGNVYTTGNFQGSTDFDPGAGIVSFNSFGGYDIFVSKLDSNGNYVWAKQMGGASDEAGNSIKTDGAGNVYSTGYFQATADFDPSSAVNNLTSEGSTDIYISKLDANGNFVWVDGIGGLLGDMSYALVLDSNNNIYITGNFQGTVDFDPGAGTQNFTSMGNYDIFVLKLNNSGNYKWVKQMGGTQDDGAYAIALGLGNTIYTTGYFQGTADFDPGSGTKYILSNGGSDIFVSKLDSNGNYVWAGDMGGTSNEAGFSILLDYNNNIVTSGFFAGTCDFDPSSTVTNLTPFGGYDVYVSKFWHNPTAVQELYSTSKSIYPNPVNGILNMEEEKNSSYILTDIYGRIITNGIVMYDKQQIDMSTLLNGVYILQLTDTYGNKENVKLVKE